MKNQNFILSDKWALRIATVFNIGYFPIASGTVASVFAALFMFIFKDIIITTFSGIGFALYLIITGLIIVYGTYSADRAEEIYKEKDSHKIVIDEVAGFFVSMLFIPVTLNNLFLAFIIFRIYDVIKPFGIRDVQKYRGGFGIMADDLLAGILTSVSVNILFWIF